MEIVLRVIKFYIFNNLYPHDSGTGPILSYNLKRKHDSHMS